MRIKICGRYYTLSFCRITSIAEDGKPHRGDCDGPHIKNKQIRINKNLRDIALLDTLIHEMLHAADWQRDEEWIEETAEDIARILTKLGYRKVE